MKRVLQVLPVGVLIVGVLFLCSCKEDLPSDVNQTTSDTTAPTENTEEKLGISIYYAGHPESQREKDFVNFLNQHFTRIQTGDLAKFNGSQAKGFDVTILDYDGDGFESPRPHLPPDFTQPVVTMGVIGAFICGERNLKTGYL